MPADFYDLLDVGPDASPEAIRRAYREKAREYHPDVNPDARSSDQFKAIRTAYEVLSDASERKDYDRMGHRTYVEQRLGGLPGSNGGTASSGPSSRSTDRTAGRRTGGSGTAGRESHSGTRSSERARSTGGTSAGSSGGSKRRSTWGERTISEPGARARAVRAGEHVGAGPLLVLAGAGYLAGLATFLVGYADALEAVGSTLLAGDLDALLAVLGAAGFVDPLPFVARAVEHPSPGLLYPVGAVAFPPVLALQAWHTRRPSWWLWAGFALGPLAGLGLAAVSIPVTVGIDLLLYVACPAVATVGGIVSYARG